MVRILGVLVAGVFVGAVGMEIVHRKCPDGLDKLWLKLNRVGSGMKEAFKEGYQSALKSRKPAEANG